MTKSEEFKIEDEFIVVTVLVRRDQVKDVFKQGFRIFYKHFKNALKRGYGETMELKKDKTKGLLKKRSPMDVSDELSSYYKRVGDAEMFNSCIFKEAEK